MTKRIITILLTFTMVFAIASCGGSKNDTKKSKEIDFSKIDKIELTCDDYSEYFVVLSDEQREYVISLWQEGQWKPGHVKSPHPYIFKAGKIIIECTLDLRIFYDEANHRTLFISDAQSDVLKSYFQTVSADAFAKIVVGMTSSEAAQILMTPGTLIAADGNGTIIKEYDCEDGSKYHISYFLDTEIIKQFVTSIIKVEPEASPEA